MSSLKFSPIAVPPWEIHNLTIHQYSFLLPLGPRLTRTLTSSVPPRKKAKYSKMFCVVPLSTHQTVFLVWNYMKKKSPSAAARRVTFLKPPKPNVSSEIGKYISAAPLMFLFSANQSVAFPKCHHFYFQLRRDTSLPQPWPLAPPYNHFIYMGHEKELQRAASA